MLAPMSRSSSPEPHPAPQKHLELEKVLGFYSVVAIVVGQVIGSGIFFKPQVVAQQTGGFVGLILTLWIVCGLVNLCGALSMGELGATVMVYPATWKTLPVTIFALTDRGQAFQAAAGTTVLLVVTLVALVGLGRIRSAAAVR
jgi:hypothetical protein